MRGSGVRIPSAAPYYVITYYIISAFLRDRPITLSNTLILVHNGLSALSFAPRRPLDLDRLQCERVTMSQGEGWDGSKGIRGL
jgi:hypothetical protein